MTKRTVWDDNNIKLRIIDKYYTVIEESLSQLEKVLNNITDINISVCMNIAINSIHRVFEYVLIKTKNIEKAYFYSQKTYFYYIEYMEQVYKTNLQNNLNQTDAVLFIYKKTIFEIQNGNESKIFDTLTNIMTLEDEITDLNHKEYQVWLEKLSKIINMVFYWRNNSLSFQNRLNLSKSLLKKYMNHIDEIHDLFYLELLQEKMTMDYNTYYSLLSEYLKYQTQHKKTVKTTEIDDKLILLKLYAEKNILYESFQKKDMKHVVRWIYT